MAEYREGSLTARVAVVALLLVFVAVFFYLQEVIAQVLVDIQLMLDFDPGQALVVISRLLLWLVISSGLVSIAVAFYLYRLAGLIIQEGLYPPTGLPVVFKTELLTGKRAARMRLLCLLLMALLLLQPLLGGLIWYGLTGGVV